MLESNVEKEKVKRRFTSVVSLGKRMCFKLREFYCCSNSR